MPYNLNGNAMVSLLFCHKHRPAREMQRRTARVFTQLVGKLCIQRVFFSFFFLPWAIGVMDGWNDNVESI